MLYQIYDIAEDTVSDTEMDFEQAKSAVAGFWDEIEDQDQWNKIMKCETLDQLNNYAAGLDFIIERMDEK